MFKIVVCLVCFGLLAVEGNAQRRGKKARTDPNAGAGNVSDTTKPGNLNQQNNNNNPPEFNAMMNLPITYDTLSQDNSAKKSLRNDNAFDKSTLTQRTPLPYENLRWDDALYAEKVWRELDLREKINRVFQYEAQDDNGSQVFVDIVMNAVQKGDVTAFSDDRFTTPMDLAAVNSITAGGYDTNYVYGVKDINTPIGVSISKKTFDTKSITKIRLKEEWVFDRESSRLFCRILGIGFMKTVFVPNTTKEMGVTALFWVYYPDLRPTLARYEVYNSKNMGQSRMTWEELFESRMFGSYIVKSTMDNPSNKMIRNYISDPILRLLEGDNIKEKIFNFEQDLWSY